MTINVRTCGIDETCQKMAGTEHGILQALSGCLLGAMVISRECFLEGYDTDAQQQQQWSTSSLVK